MQSFAGKFDQLISLWREVRSPDGQGGVIISWEEEKKIWARLHERRDFNRAQENFGGVDRSTTNVELLIRSQMRNYFIKGKKVIFRQREYKIESVDETENRATVRIVLSLREEQ